MFVLKASTWLKALQQFCPDIATATQHAWAGKSRDVSFVRPEKAAFASIPSESIDYAVMEKITNPTTQPSEPVKNYKNIRTTWSTVRALVR